MAASDKAILERLDALQASFEEFRQEYRADTRDVRAQLNTLEFGVLTIAQKLLASSEVREIRERMRTRAAAAG